MKRLAIVTYCLLVLGLLPLSITDAQNRPAPLIAKGGSASAYTTKEQLFGAGSEQWPREWYLYYPAVGDPKIQMRRLMAIEAKDGTVTPMCGTPEVVR